MNESEKSRPKSRIGLEYTGLKDNEKIFWNLTPPELYEHAIRNGEGILTSDYALRVLTGEYTGRSPEDRFIIDEPSVRDEIDWGPFNQPGDPELFDRMWKKVVRYMQDRPLYVKDLYAGADPEHRLNVRIVSEAAYHALFAHNMFIRPDEEGLINHKPDFTILAAPDFHADPENDGTRSGTFILISFEKKLILIGGTLYSGEVKKGIFSVLNHLLPKRGVMPMHCSANMDEQGNSALFFGLSGTGKTTLSSDPDRILIGDDEHGWSDSGIFNFEGGCYAKTIGLDEESEPLIYNTTRMPGTILENVVLNEKREPQFEDDFYTENTRCAYPIHYIPNASKTGMGGHPTHIIFLTCDALGVLPPISRLTPEQAMFHFINGYTAKIPGTERGVTEPEVTFSACFGAPFIPHPPAVYAELLAEKIRRHNASVWLVNTGWTGGPYGTGRRIRLRYTRKMLSEALSGRLDKAEFRKEPFFDLAYPAWIDGVPTELLNPRDTWADTAAYDAKARKLADRFIENHNQFRRSS